MVIFKMTKLDGRYVSWVQVFKASAFLLGASIVLGVCVDIQPMQGKQIEFWYGLGHGALALFGMLIFLIGIFLEEGD